MRLTSEASGGSPSQHWRMFAKYEWLRTIRALVNIMSREKLDIALNCRYINFKEVRSSFSALRVEVLKLQSRIEDKLRSPSYYIINSKYDQS